jgi:hypothetical protein
MSVAVAPAQEDGACTVPLVLSPAVQAELEDILFESTSGFGPAEHGLAAPLVTVAPVPDGQISPNEYPNRCFYSYVDRENPGNPYPTLDTIEDRLGDDDVSLHLYLAHTDEFLFLGFEVTDEFLDLEEGAVAWQNDSIELFINADLELDDFNPDTVGRFPGREGFQIIGDAAGDGDFDLNNRLPDPLGTVEPFPISPSEGVPQPGEFLSAGKPSATGYVVEFQIPLGSLDTDSDDGMTVVPAQTGDVLLMNAVVNDNDVEGATGQDTHAMLWMVEDDPRSPYGGGENIWVVPLGLTESVGEQVPPLWAGDADQDLDFDQLDLVKVQIAAKYLVDLPATWGEGDWNGAPGGKQGEPPAGDGRFNQLDVIAALGPGHYLQGPYAALAGTGAVNDDQTSIIYDATTGEVGVDAPAGRNLTSINLESAASIFTGDAAENLGGDFDNDSDNNIFKATFGSSFGSLSFGKIAQPGLSQEFVLGDLTVIGSLEGGGEVGPVDLIYIPEPSAIVLLGLGCVMVMTLRRRRQALDSVTRQ